MSPRPEEPEPVAQSSSTGAEPGAQSSSNLQPGRVVTVLSVSGSEADHLSLGHLFRHTKWTLLQCTNCGDAARVLREHQVPVIICDRSLPDGVWTDLLELAAGLPCPPLMIVACRLADDRLWAEVMNRGGYDVLEKPFNQAEVVRVVSLAWLAWKNHWQRTAEAGRGGDQNR